MICKLVILCLCAAAAQGYSSGAPEDVCEDMVPRHPGSPQISEAPYTIALDRSKINSNGIVKVTISGNNGGTFKGFFVQGRVGGVPVGSFEINNAIKLVNCGKGVQTAATHTSSDDKKQVVLKWRAPKGLSESVYFNTTIAQDGGTYWVGLLSPRLQVTKTAN